MRRAGAAEAMLESVWLAQHGALCRGINWERHSLEDLGVIASCVGGRALAAICRLLAEDYSGWSGAWAPRCLWGRRASIPSQGRRLSLMKCMI